MAERAEFSIRPDDGSTLHGYQWTGAAPPNAVLLVVHGMAEHIGRYGDFASTMADAGCPVFGVDLRGHGRTGAALESIGFIAENDGWKLILSDLDRFVEEVRFRYPKQPLVLFGHSMGSFFCRSYAARNGRKIDGMILSGTGTTPRLVSRAGLAIGHLIRLFTESHAQSRLMHELTVGGFGRAIRGRRTAMDWLSRDHAEVDKYISDPYCGMVMSISFYIDLIRLVLDKGRRSIYKNTPKQLPIFLVSGTSDPVGSFARGVLSVFSGYQREGFTDIRLKLYQDARHELLNETNRKEVYKDILDWLSYLVERRRSPA